MQDVLKFPYLSRAIRAVWFQLLILAALLSGHVLLEFIPEAARHPTYARILAFLTVWVGAWIVARITNVLREAPVVQTRLAPNLRPPVFFLVRLVIYALAFLIALDSLGVSITPLLASLGVGSLAVGLALQDTLGNLFSGFYLYVDRPIAIGDWVRLENGTEGQVIAIGWRTTHLVVGGVNRLIIPNSKISSSMLTNYNLPTAQTNLVIPIGVAYESDLDHVEKTLLETVERVRANMGSLFNRDAAPLVRYSQFGESSIDLSLVVPVQSFPDQFLVRHELIKAIKAAFDGEKIDIPYPQRVFRQLPASTI